MYTLDEVRAWRGRVAIDREGKRIGELVDVYVDDRSDLAWAAVDTGQFDGRLSFAPLTGASPRGAELRLKFSRRRVTDAPNAARGELLSSDQERSLFEHYGLEYGARAQRAA